MAPKVKRNLATKILALALVAAACALATGSRAARAPQGAGQTQRGDKVSPELRQFMRAGGADTVSVIIQLGAQPTGQLNALLQRNGVRVHGRFANLDAVAAELPASVVNELADFEEIESLTRDRDVSSSGHMTATTGADAVRTLPSLKSGSIKVDGTGVGIAVLDSGVYAAHLALKDASGGARTVYAQDFTGENKTDDPYGHGSHVASTAAGNDKLSGQSGTYAGVAPNASIVNLRVLDSTGRGRVSWVLAALDWVVANGSRYKVRVVNLSLGMPALDSYKVDPLCKAVRRLVDAGFVVVAAAGNDGKSTSNKYGTNNTKTYGLIHSPGNEPSALTVGATNTFGTDDRRDDGVATYSSRGPTRSFWTDASGVKHYDNLVKPDLVAPGNKIVYAKGVNNYLATNYTLSVTPNEGVGDTRAMMYMSGTSVASPVVAGAAALMLQVNPSLTPNMVKMILMYTSQPLSGFNMLEQGSGQLNVDGAVRLAQRVRTDISTRTKVGDPLLSTTAPAAQSTVAGYTFPWAQGMTVNHGFVTGSALASKYQLVYAKGRLLGDAVSETSDAQSLNPSLMSSGILMGEGILMGDGTPWGGEPVFMASGILMGGDGILMGDGLLLPDGILMGDGTLTGDGILMGDNTVGSLSVLVSGDSTACMK